MKHQIKLKPAISQMVALCYQSMKAAQEYARGINTDNNVEYLIQNDFIHIAASLTTPLERIEKRIPRSVWDQFKTQIKDNDALRLENIKNLFIRMTPEKQEMAEMLMEGILKGELEVNCCEK